MSERKSRSVPVAIIGGGVVGLSMATALARQGVQSVVLERASQPNRHPRAHVANPRTLELFRLWGIENEVRAAGLPAAATGNFRWLTAMSGSVLGEIRYQRGPNEPSQREELTLTPEVSCAQDVIESILRRRLKQLTGDDVRYGARVIETSQGDDGNVALKIESAEEPLLARYVVAADGAGSATRKRLGIAMEGPDELARFASIYLHADLSQWTDRAPAVLYWIVNSRVQGVFISMDGRSRYVFHVRINPDRDSFEQFTPERCRILLQDAIGAGPIDLDIREIGQWIMSGQVAERYRAGNVFLVGDSAHRFPPTGGFGMNTGIQDAHNLAWKLSAVLNGWAPVSLLDSYERERRPVADLNRSRSVSNFLRLEDLAIWSLDPRPIVERLEAPGPTGDAERVRFRDEVERQRGHFDKLGQELGFIYQAGALALTPAPNGNGSLPSEGGVDATGGVPAVLGHVSVGARAPLVRMLRPDGSPVATTDLFEREFVVLADESTGWEGAAAHLAATGVPIRCLQIGRDLIDPSGSWAQAADLRTGGAVLVRPDGHVGFRAPAAPADPTRALTQAMDTILRGGRDS